jgi:alkylation response protein AidB-like acyl-CoA dehydrogenase
MKPGGTVQEFADQARTWLESVAKRRTDPVATPWGEGSDDVSVFHNLTEGEERVLLDEAMAWQRTKFDAGYGAISWPAEYGGAGLAPEYEAAFGRVENDFEVPPGHETFSVTVSLVAPTIRELGTAEQRHELIPRFLRTDQLCCQLFSEPGAGSDLASLSTRAVRDGDDWVVHGQKVWSSGAQFSAWGELIARTDRDSKHAGLTAFMVPMDSAGVTVRPIRQMSGGSSFNEVFLDGVRIPDRLRLGQVGRGWEVALTTLGFERAGSGGSRSVGGSWQQLAALARHLDCTDDPLVRQELARCYVNDRVRSFVRHRVEQTSASGGAPGPEGSIGKLLWTRSLAEISDLASRLLGPRLTADTGEWGTWAWSAHVLGAPGYRIAGGSDEIQHNITAERVLGLPREPRPAPAAHKEKDK